MKHLSYTVRDRSEFTDMLQKASGALAKLPVISSVLVSVFCTKLERTELEDMIQKLQGFLPDAQVIGSLVAMSVADDTIVEKGASVTFTVFSQSQTEILTYTSRSMSCAEIGQALRDRLREMPDAVAVELMLVDSSLELTDILANLSDTREDIQFFGGIIDEDYMGQNGCIFTEGEVMTSGLVAVVFRGKELHVASMDSFGWEALGRDMVVTAMDGPCVIKELDNVPAMDAYENYLGIKNNENFTWEALTFPLYFEREDTLFARYPRSCRSDGAVMFSADFQIGEHLHFAYGDPEGIVEKARNLRQGMRQFRPQGIFVTSCIARWMLLGDDVGLELDSCREIAPFSGFYAFGEFLRHEKDVMVSNMTLRLVGMREGPPGEAMANPLPPHLRKFSWQTHIMRHMVHFIKAVSQELEAVNQGLAELAQTDRLTTLLNRGEMEAVLERSLDFSKASKQPLSVLMMDIDDFKTINDTYGHEVGDQALKVVADVLKRNTRRMDAPCRWGGDEFFVILTGIGVQPAAMIAERVRQTISGISFLPDGRHITTSIGVTEATAEDDAASLFRRADKALYRAKKEQGKDNVSILDSVEE